MISTFLPRSPSYLNNQEVESLHVEIYPYQLGNKGMLTLLVLVLLIIISPINVLCKE